jgi:polyhydroxyalkanoate synthase subunit PhaC
MIEDNQEIIQVAIKIYEKSQQIFKTYFGYLNHQPHMTISQWIKLIQLYQKFVYHLMKNPSVLINMQISYWQNLMTIYQEFIMRWSGECDISEISAASEDKRFQHNDWEEHPVFNFIKKYYSLTANTIQTMVTLADGLDEKTEKQINFYTQQFIDATSPCNFVITNPEVLRLTLKTKGQNLLNGLENMHEDLERNNGQFNIKMTDLNAFRIGENIASTPGKVVYQNDLMQLIQYHPKTLKIFRRPLLIVPPWINKYYILDLSEHNSFVSWLLEQGYTVFMISWINPDSRYSEKDFENYLFEGPLAALNAITKGTGEKHISALGYCVGGTLLACTLAYLAAKKDKRIVSATYLNTLLDFSDPGDIAALIDEEHIEQLERQMFEKGYLDGRMMSLTFNVLRSNHLIWSYYVKNYLQGEEPLPFDLLYWNSDVTNMPARMHSFYLRNMYLNNRLSQPESIKLGDVTIDLRRIKIPVYFLSTCQDHISPWKTTYQGLNLHSGPLTFVLGGSGHIAGIVNHPSKNKYCYYTNNNVSHDPDTWLKNATEHSGSWWPHWENWLRKYSGKKIAVRRQMKKNKLSVLEDAPGSYVKVQLSGPGKSVPV